MASEPHDHRQSTKRWHQNPTFTEGTQSSGVGTSQSQKEHKMAAVEPHNYRQSTKRWHQDPTTVTERSTKQRCRNIIIADGAQNDGIRTSQSRTEHKMAELGHHNLMITDEARNGKARTSQAQMEHEMAAMEPQNHRHSTERWHRNLTIMDRA